MQLCGEVQQLCAFRSCAASSWLAKLRAQKAEGAGTAPASQAVHRLWERGQVVANASLCVPAWLQVALLAVSAVTASLGHVLEEQHFVKRPETEKRLILEGPLAAQLEDQEGEGRGGRAVEGCVEEGGRRCSVCGVVLLFQGKGGAEVPQLH